MSIHRSDETNQSILSSYPQCILIIVGLHEIQICVQETCENYITRQRCYYIRRRDDSQWQATAFSLDRGSRRIWVKLIGRRLCTAYPNGTNGNIKVTLCHIRKDLRNASHTLYRELLQNNNYVSIFYHRQLPITVTRIHA